MRRIILIVLVLSCFVSTAGAFNSSSSEKDNKRNNDISSVNLLGATSECTERNMTDSLEGTVFANSGCCSHHGGVCGCSGGTVMCCDGMPSPSCGCGY